MLKELAIVGGAAGAIWFFFLRGKKRSSARGAKSGTSKGGSWELVTDDAPMKVDPATGKAVPIWYFNAPVDPSDRWAGLVVSHNQDAKAFPAPIVVVVVRKTGGSSPAPVGFAQAISLEIVSTEAAADGGLTGRVVQDPSVAATNMIPPNLRGDDAFAPELGTEIAFTPSDVILQVQP